MNETPLDQADGILWLCNETELLQMAKSQGWGPLRRGLPREVLIQIVRGAVEPTQEQLALTHDSRKKLQAYLKEYWTRVASQLPGCTGKCTEFPCSEGKHCLCFEPNKNFVG